MIKRLLNSVALYCPGEIISIQGFDIKLVPVSAFISLTKCDILTRFHRFIALLENLIMLRKSLKFGLTKKMNTVECIENHTLLLLTFTIM